MKKNYIIISVLIFSTLAIFLPLLNYEFVSWDDGIHVYNNPRLNPPSLKDTIEFWSEPYLSLYIPLTYSVWSLLAWISIVVDANGLDAAPNPHIYHAANVIIHTLTVLVVFCVLRILIGWDFGKRKDSENTSDEWRKKIAAGFGALLFSIHPMQVEPVAWVSGMKDILYGFFFMTALWQYLCYLKAVPGEEKSFSKKYFIQYLFITFMYVLALLAKPSAVVFPLITFLLNRLLTGRSFLKILKSHLLWVLLALPIIIITRDVQTIPAGYLGESPILLWTRPFIVLDAITFYIYKLVFPLWLGPDYGRTPGYVLESGAIYYAFLIPLFLATIVWLKKEQKIWLSAMVFFIFPLLPVLGFFEFLFQRFSTVADRYFYCSMLGPSLVLSWIVYKRGTKVALLICLSMITFYGFRTALQVRHWENNITLFKSTIALNPQSFMAYNNLGIALADKGEKEEAIAHYKRALHLKPNYLDAHNNLGVALVDKGENEEAIVHYKRALKIKRNFADAHNNLGVVLADIGEREEAIVHYKRALQIKPDYADAHNNLGIVLSDKGEKEEAIAHYKRALQIKPNHAEAHNNLGIVLSDKGEKEEAIAHYKRALQIKPNYAEAHNNLGVVLSDKGEKEEAIAHYKRALQIKPDYTDAHNNLGIVLAE